MIRKVVVVADDDSSAAALRGWAARQMVAEDARWGMDVVLSGRQAIDIEGYIPLLLGHHMVRIAYEGVLMLRSPNPHVGVPKLAALLRERYAAITARARHVTKLLDDTNKSYDDVLLDLESVLAEHHNRLTGNTFRWARWLETDLGLFCCEEKLAGATVPTAYRLGLNITDAGTISGEDLLAVSEEWGGTLVVLGAAALDGGAPTATIDFTRSCGITYRNQLASRYFPRRFEPDFPDSLKALLLLIEGDLNTARTLLLHTAADHVQPAFRARTITVYHSLTALKQIADRYPQRDTAGMLGLRALLADGPTRRLLSPDGRKVRNRCMHYPLNDPAVLINPSLPMFGIVEAVYPGNTWERFNTDVASVTDRIADHLGGWKPAGRR